MIGIYLFLCFIYILVDKSNKPFIQKVVGTLLFGWVLIPLAFFGLKK